MNGIKIALPRNGTVHTNKNEEKSERKKNGRRNIINVVSNWKRISKIRRNEKWL